MKPLLPEILILFLLSGCASSQLSVNGGTAKFSIPFDFPNMEKQVLRERKMLEEMEKLECEATQSDEETLSF